MYKRIAVMTALCFCLIAVTPIQASLQAVLVGNDTEGLQWLANNAGASGLTLLVKDDLPTLTGLVPAADWTLNLASGGRSGDWEIDNALFTPEYWLVKFGQMVAVYSYMGPGSSPWSDSFNLGDIFTPGTGQSGTLLVPVVDVNNGVVYAAGAYNGPPNIGAATSHVSVYGQVIPEPATLVVWALLGLVAVTGSLAVRKRDTASE